MKISEFLIFDKDTVRFATIHLFFNRQGQLIQRNSFEDYEDSFIEYHYTDDKLSMVTCWRKIYFEESHFDTTFYYYTPYGCPEKYVSGNNTTLLLCDSLCHITMEINNYQDTVHCTYDEYGRIVKWCNWERCDEGCDGCTTYIYDNQGRLVKKQHRHRYSNGDEEFFYNGEGDVSDSKDTFGLGEQIHYEYTYDGHGNWLTRRHRLYVTQREITYYE